MLLTSVSACAVLRNSSASGAAFFVGATGFGREAGRGGATVAALGGFTGLGRLAACGELCTGSAGLAGATGYLISCSFPPIAEGADLMVSTSRRGVMACSRGGLLVQLFEDKCGDVAQQLQVARTEIRRTIGKQPEDADELVLGLQWDVQD